MRRQRKYNREASWDHGYWQQPSPSLRWLIFGILITCWYNIYLSVNEAKTPPLVIRLAAMVSSDAAQDPNVALFLEISTLFRVFQTYL